MIDARKIPGYGDKYLVWKDGSVFRRKANGELVPVAASGNPPRVCLTRGDGSPRTRPYVHALVAELFLNKAQTGVRMELDIPEHLK